MKLAEALMLRSDYQVKISDLQNRLLLNLRYQEGDKPIEDPNSLLTKIAEINQLNNELIKKINKANATALLDEDVYLGDALVDRDTLKKQHQVISQIIKEGNVSDVRYSRMEIKMVIAVDIPALQQQLDDLADTIRKLEMKIQAKNWQVTL